MNGGVLNPQDEMAAAAAGPATSGRPTRQARTTATDPVGSPTSRSAISALLSGL